MTITVRPGRPADLPALILLNNTGFGVSTSERSFARYAEFFRIENARVAVDGDRAVGLAMTATMALTVPGGAEVAARAVTSASTAPTHRRRGVLRSILADIHSEARAARIPVAILTASEGGIYGRFGYGPAVDWRFITVRREQAAFHACVPDPGGVAMAPMSDAAQVIPAGYERWRRINSGAQARPQPEWANLFADDHNRSPGRTPLFALLHPDGYALYRVVDKPGDNRFIEVDELRAVTADAQIALWRVLLRMDLFEEVKAVVALDDPLARLLIDPRAVRTTKIQDALWLRLLDVPAAFTARGYAADVDVVIDVADPAFNAGGRFRLTVTGGNAHCAPTDGPADLECDIDVLGSVYLGGYRASAFATANRLRGKDNELIARFDAALATERAPQLGWFF